MTNQPGELGAAIDRAARYLRETQQGGKNLNPWDRTPKATKRKWLLLAEGLILAATPTRNDGAGDVERMMAERDEARAITKRIQSAAKTIMIGEADELLKLREEKRGEWLASKTLDSEREANAILTEENATLRAALSALSQKGGWQLVPVEPTEAMIDAGDAAHFRKRNDMTCIAPTEHPDEVGGPFGYAWRAMLDAAPVSAPHGGDVG